MSLLINDDPIASSKNEWELADQNIDWYFIPKLLEFYYADGTYYPFLICYHTPNMLDAGLVLTSAVRGKEVYSNEDSGWIVEKDDNLNFVLGYEKFGGDVEIFSSESVDRNSDKLYHLRIDPSRRAILLEQASDTEDEKLRLWLLENNMRGVVYKRTLSRLILKRFPRKDFIINIGETINEYTDLENSEVLNKIKQELGIA